MSNLPDHLNRDNRKVAPDPASISDITEIRKNRTLRICHLNPRKRNDALNKEIKVYQHYQQNGTRQQVPQNASKVMSPRSSRDNARAESSRKENLSITKNSFPPGVVEDKQTSENDRLPNSQAIDAEKIPQFSNIGDAENMPSEYSRPLSNVVLARSSVSRDSTSSNPDRKTVMSSSSVVVSLDPGGKEDLNNKIMQMKNTNNIVENDEVSDARTSGDKRSRSNSGKPTLSHDSKRKLSGSKENREKSQSEAITNNNINRETIGNSHNDAKLYASENNATKETPKEVLFFIHGVGGSLDVWKPQLDYFSGLGYEVISPDLIGHGMSCTPDQPRAYHFQEILADIEVIFDTYCKEKNIVVGHSYGCAFATVLARRRTRRVSKLVLVSGGGPVPLAPQAGIFSLPLCMLYCIRPCIMCTFRRSAFYSGSGKREENKQMAFDVPAYVLSYIMNGQWWLDGDELFHSWINVPTLLIWGRHDKFVGLQEEEDMLKVVYGSRLEIIETAGHMVMMEAPSEFNHILYHFIIDSPLPAQTTQDKSAVNSNSETSVGHPSNQNTKDKVAEWATPRGNKTKHNMGSRVSVGSVLSYKSTKSSKSMPQGVLSHHSKKS